ncbi:hypothetical protein NDU88_005447 [Pleurodeles waltl]|uniref:Uncharacterized protein n=1 Tax=Pleurodeles waltl TaxID=8319 RepID=A0AAV7LLH4_PLEWA|nr:hypothetical protein NDU88_005447 [Pleurodeles waltl]
MGFAPAGATASGEQHPGPSGMHGGPIAWLADMELRGEWQQKGAQAAERQREDLWCEEDCVLDFEEHSFEEGELVDEGKEEGWWVHRGRFESGARSCSFSVIAGLSACAGGFGWKGIGRSPDGEAEGTGVATVVDCR